MSLDDLKLSPYLVAKLYEHSLVLDDEKPVKKTKAAASQAKSASNEKETGTNAADIKHLGSNNRNILILVNEKDHAFLNDADLAFLISILNACKISVEDTALVNTCNNAEAVYENLAAQFSPAIILFIGTEPQDLGFPVQIPRYRIQQYNRQQYVCAPSLAELSADKEAKKQLWNVLKVLFEIK